MRNKNYPAFTARISKNYPASRAKKEHKIS
jgi:hypothetical protein